MRSKHKVKKRAAKKAKAKKSAPVRRDKLSPYQRQVKKMLAGPQGREIKAAFGGQPEVIYGLRVCSSLLAAQVRERTGDMTFSMHDWAIPWATAVNNRLDKEGATVGTFKGTWLPKLEACGVVKLLARLGGGFYKVDFAPLAGIVQPLLDSVPVHAPSRIEAEVDKVRKRNSMIESVVMRQAAEQGEAAKEVVEEMKKEALTIEAQQRRDRAMKLDELARRRREQAA